jgi:mRNA interferase RelE/StbE
VATQSRYQVQILNLVKTEDLPNLSIELQQDFRDICESILTHDPYNCCGFPNHLLKGRLKDYHSLEIDYLGIAYRLVYRIYEKSSPKRVVIISFDEHDSAYDKAKTRTGRKK